ncbi:hypothetical protein Poli38472_009013 [Pythium oligandrum]|uniref:Hexose transporter 1 n=1 Tax=Pythium oligandrum TaxID=41045 RepID=A0A8K1FJE9_PYTOL|nr:hypothetical protein Poli38472_009013 [Pythium oligandrum]|eukprot:TMW64846.1 hypothetical protein Poli38472_009013 [Pythium oligandrum]
MTRTRRSWGSLLRALQDPSRSEFAFVPHQHVYAPTEVITVPYSPTENTPINDVSKAPRSHRTGPFRQQANWFFAMHVLTIGVSCIACAWIALFPISPNRLYNIQVDVFNTNHDHTVYFFGQCMYLGMLFGAAIAGYMGDRLGRAGTLELAAVPYMLGWLMLGVAYGEVSVLLGRYLLGLAGGMMAVTAPIYMAEISAVRTRGRLLCIHALFTGIGRLCYVGIGAVFICLSHQYFGFNLSDWKVLSIIGLLPGLGLLLLAQRLPGSPTWLVVRHNDHETAFAILHKLFCNDYVRAEQELNGIVHANILSCEEHTHHGAFFRPLLLCCTLFSLRAIASFLIEPRLSQTPTETFVVTVFGVNLDVGDVQLLTVLSLLWVALSVGTLGCFLVVDYRGRVAALQAGCIMVLVGCMLVLLTAYRQEQSSLQVTEVGSATLLLITAGHQLGLGIVPLVAASELFPARQRSGAVSLVIIAETLTNLGLSSLVPWLRETLSFGQVFHLSVLAVIMCNTLGIFIAWFYLPETSQRSLQSIEAIISGWYPDTPTMSRRQSRVRLAGSSNDMNRSYGTPI